MKTRHRRPSEPRVKPRTTSSAWSAAWILIIAISLFLLGCFVVGPGLSRYRSAPQPAATQVAPPDETVVSTPPERIQPEEKPQVRIAERRTPRPTASTTKTPDVLTSDTAPVPAPPATTVPSVPEETAEPMRDADGGILYRVQAGLFAEKANADELAKQITERGFQAHVSQMLRDDKPLYCVQAGIFRNRDAAAQLADALEQAGIDAVVTVAAP